MTETKLQSWREMLPLAWDIYRDHAAGCCLHVALDDGNLEDGHVSWLLSYAREHGHPACIALAEMMQRSSRTQREKLYGNRRAYALDAVPRPTV